MSDGSLYFLYVTSTYLHFRLDNLLHTSNISILFDWKPTPWLSFEAFKKLKKVSRNSRKYFLENMPWTDSFVLYKKNSLYILVITFLFYNKTLTNWYKKEISICFSLKLVNGKFIFHLFLVWLTVDVPIHYPRYPIPWLHQHS